ncbi:hypothetical protein Mapa_001489 [Marchantia paleacea]|nr:hypothetical protein Mapa_001489 [Marchantia paleacea]
MMSSLGGDQSHNRAGYVLQDTASTPRINQPIREDDVTTNPLQHSLYILATEFFHNPVRSRPHPIVLLAPVGKVLEIPLVRQVHARVPVTQRHHHLCTGLPVPTTHAVRIIFNVEARQFSSVIVIHIHCGKNPGHAIRLRNRVHCLTHFLDRVGWQILQEGRRIRIVHHGNICISTIGPVAQFARIMQP